MSISVGGLIGVCRGMLCGLLAWWIGRKKTQNQRGFTFKIVAISTADWRFLPLSLSLALFGLIYARKSKVVKE